MRRTVLWILFYLAVWFTTLALLVTFERYDAVEAIFALVLAGGGFSLVAWLLTRKATPAGPVSMRAPAWMLIAYTLLVAAYVTWAPFENDFAKAAAKLILFVAIPLFLFKVKLPFRFNRRDLAITLAMSLVLTLFQLAFGGGLKRIAASDLGGATLVLAFVASFLWMTIEAGLVEEFFFRALLQTRLEEATKSAAGGIVLASILFGLIHAPGLYLRTAQTNETFGGPPSPLMAIGFSIVVLSVVAPFLGILWSRTRNLIIVVIIHGAIDLIPNVIDVAKTLGIGR